MYIKQVIIQGFRSYHEQTVVEPFDPKLNVVVGRNGSGKSNFFFAIQFVLSDEYLFLRSEQRQGLLYQGIGPSVISAYVEIIFDNTDRRFLIDKDEVYLRRVIGSKKDNYFLNKKNVSKMDVANFLESAGFSKSNSYYIVKQGQINQLALAPDSQRLKLFCEISGTRVYDERREESKSILKETEDKLEKVLQLLRTIEERIQILEEEKEELKEYQKWDKQKRCLEYLIYERELNEAKQKLAKCKELRAISGVQQFGADAKKAHEKTRSAAERLKKIMKMIDAAEKEISRLVDEQQQLFKKKAELRMIINDFEDEMKADEMNKIQGKTELENLLILIEEKEKELEVMRPTYESMKRSEETYASNLALKEQQRKNLYAKLNRGTQFCSKEARDEWIKNELKILTRQIKDKQDHTVKIMSELKRDNEKHEALKKKIDARTVEMETLVKLINDRNIPYSTMNTEKDEKQATRKELYRHEMNVQLKLTELKEDLAKVDQKLRFVTGKPVFNTLDSIRKVLDTFREQPEMMNEVGSYHGLVIENFECDESMHTAVEVIAGNRLFYHIVEYDEFGTKILKEMNNQRLPGEVTFMPMNRLRVGSQDYPKTSDAFPMISRLKYDLQYDRVMRHIFGKTMVCRSLEIATNVAKETGYDCVTIEGDQVSSKGSLTGGFHDTSRSRLKTFKTRSDLMRKMAAYERMLATLKDDIRNADEVIISYVGQMQRMETKNSKAKDIIGQMKEEICMIKEELGAIERYRKPKEQSYSQCTLSLEAMKATKEELENELHQDLMAQLSVADQEQIDTLNDEIRALSKENKIVFSKRIQYEAKINKLENLLTNNLMRRRDELIQAFQEISVEDRQHQLDSSKTQLANIEEKLKSIDDDIRALNIQFKDASEKQKSESIEIEKWKLVEKEEQDKFETANKNLENVINEENILQQKIADCTQKITDLGALPNLEIYRNLVPLRTKQLFSEIKKTNEQLRNYSHVNKNALDQFISFSDQKEKLIRRKEELDRGGEKIKELMYALEQRRQEAIEFTFKQVSKYFSEVFKKLVPSGHAQLVMKTAGDEEGDDAGSETADSNRFTGVGIRVSYTSQSVEMKEMNQLSGGQKSLVALALIFAIQKCDPAPFYLFDEIDQALDAQHRKAVADMIHELSSDAQFIITTFRPELLQHANKFYSVKFRNKVSYVEYVTREEATDFVEDDTTHG